MKTPLKTQKNLLTGLGLALLIVTTFYACSSSTGKESKAAAQASPEAQGIPVDGHVLQSNSLKEEMEVTGTLHAKQEVNIMSELSRKVVSVHVQEGRFVGQGALLFKLDDADLRAQLEQLIQQEKLARLNEQRLKDLIEHQAVMQQDYDQTFTNLKVLQAQIKQVKVSIEKTNIRAPFSGTVGIVNVYPGTLVAPGTSLAILEDNSQIKLDFSVPEKYTSALKSGDALQFSVQSSQGLYNAKVVALESKLDNETRTLLIRAVGENPGKELLAGQSARLKISLKTSENALQVPNQALIPSSQGYSVYVASGNKAQIKPVEIGQRDAFSVHVINGLEAGDTIITSNMLRLSPGADIQLVSVK